MSDLYLHLENGTVFKGKSFGYDGEALGELVFTTGMTGYLETLSDPAYFGQIVLQTFPLIGNYGVIPNDFGSGPVHLSAYIVRDWCQEPSNFRSEGNLDSFLRDMKIPGLFDIDTRELAKVIRESGVMNAMISKSPELSAEQWAELRGYTITRAVATVCGAQGQRNADQASGLRVPCSGDEDQNRGLNGQGSVDANQCLDDSIQGSGDKNLGLEGGNRHPAPGDCRFHAVLWDFGCAYKLIPGLVSHGISPLVVGFEAFADDILALNPDGIILSGGPGDPAENARIIAEIRKLCDSGIPILAVGLGHQMLALARGAATEKLPFGHRGANQPVSECGSARVFVTNQNHGYAVVPDSLPKNAVMSYKNLSDGTCEGIKYDDIPAHSVQFDPTEEVFTAFIATI